MLNSVIVKFAVHCSGAMVLALAVVCLSPAHAFDPEEFNRLDRTELRAAEDRMSEFVDPATGELRRELRNDEERYVAKRQKRRAERARPSLHRTSETGEAEADEMPWPMTRGTRVRIDQHGQPVFDCAGADALLTSPRPDFRFNASNRRVIQ